MTRTSRTAGNESGCRFSAAFMMVKEMEGRLYDPEKNRRGRKIDPFKVSYYSHSVTFHPGNDSSCHRLSLPLYPADILILRDNDNGQKTTTTRKSEYERTLYWGIPIDLFSSLRHSWQIELITEELGPSD